MWNVEDKLHKKQLILKLKINKSVKSSPCGVLKNIDGSEGLRL